MNKYNTLTANITCNFERLKAFLLRSGTRQGRPLLPLLVPIEPKALGEKVDGERNKKVSRLERSKITSGHRCDMKCRKSERLHRISCGH